MMIIPLKSLLSSPEDTPHLPSNIAASEINIMAANTTVLEMLLQQKAELKITPGWAPLSFSPTVSTWKKSQMSQSCLLASNSSYLWLTGGPDSSSNLCLTFNLRHTSLEMLPGGWKPAEYQLDLWASARHSHHLSPSTEVSNPDWECSTVLLLITKLWGAGLPFILHERVAAGLDMLEVQIRLIMWPSA